MVAPPYGEKGSFAGVWWEAPRGPDRRMIMAGSGSYFCRVAVLACVISSGGKGGLSTVSANKWCSHLQFHFKQCLIITDYARRLTWFNDGGKCIWIFDEGANYWKPNWSCALFTSCRYVGCTISTLQNIAWGTLAEKLRGSHELTVRNVNVLSEFIVHKVLHFHQYF